MKSIIKARWILIVGLIFLIPLSAVAADKEGSLSDTSGVTVQEQKAPTDVRSNRKIEQGGDSQGKVEHKGSTTPVNMPIYKPPLRGAPAGRVAGGTRGVSDKLPYLCLLVPEHVGLTTNDQPCLYYFMSNSTEYPVEFTIIEKRGVYPLIESRIRSTKQPGIHAICLSDYGVRLKKGIQYRWFVALVPDAQHRSKDALAAGAIELVDLQNDLKTRLHKSSETEIPYVYAEAGIWYDALSALSLLIKKEPRNKMLRKERASLIEQVGLERVAEYEVTNWKGSGN